MINGYQELVLDEAYPDELVIRRFKDMMNKEKESEATSSSFMKTALDIMVCRS